MPRWQDIKDKWVARELFRDIWSNMHTFSPSLGRHGYARNLLIAVQEAIHCNYGKIVAVEFGVAAGNGLLELCSAAKYFRDKFEIEILVAGFDTGGGLPPPEDYRDHPELFREGAFLMGDPAALRAKLPDFCQLILGDIGDTVTSFLEELGDARLGFVAVDVDYYSSTKKALRLLTGDPEAYLPVVPMCFDDVYAALVYNPWCGEQLAITEFNQENRFRKISPTVGYRIPPQERAFMMHVLDHPLRTGQQKLRPGFELNLEPF